MTSTITTTRSIGDQSVFTAGRGGEIFVGGSHGFQGKRTRDQSSTTEYEGRTKKIDGQ